MENIGMTIEKFELWLSRIPAADVERLAAHAEWVQLREKALDEGRVSRALLDLTGDILNDDAESSPRTP